jgi:hypothetical protein
LHFIMPCKSFVPPKNSDHVEKVGFWASDWLKSSGTPF